MAHGLPGGRTFHHGVGEAAEFVNLDFDDVADRHRPRVPRCASQYDVARQQGDVAAQVREEIVDSPDHLAHGAFLDDSAIEIGAKS